MNGVFKINDCIVQCDSLKIILFFGRKGAMFMVDRNFRTTVVLQNNTVVDGLFTPLAQLVPFCEPDGELGTPPDNL